MHKLEIRNFGPILKADIEVGNLTVIIGEQATGKSTISKLIYFFQTLRDDALKSVLHSIDAGGNPSSIFKQEIQQKFIYFFKLAYIHPNTSIKYFFSKEGYFEISIVPPRAVRVLANQPYWVNIDPALHEIKDLLQSRSATSILRDIQTPQTQAKEILEEVFPGCQQALYIPAGRNITVGYSEQFEQYFRDRLILELNSPSALLQSETNRLPTADMFLLETFMKRVAEIKDRFRDAGGGFTNMIQRTNRGGRFRRSSSADSRKIQIMRKIGENISEIIRGEYRADGPAERIQFSSNKFIWLREASSGQQESIRILQDMMLLAYDGQPVFRAIEEPEAHLFPMAQQHLINLISLAQDATGSCFVLTTHSPYIVSALNNILFASQLPQNGQESALPIIDSEKVRGYMLSRDAETETVASETLLQDMGRTGQPLKLMGHTSLDDVAESMGMTFNQLKTKYRSASSATTT